MTLTVGIVGGGPWGISLARAVARTGTEVTHFTRRDTKKTQLIHHTTSYAEVAKAKLIILAVPSNVAREVLRGLGDHLDGSHLVVHGIRGLAPLEFEASDTPPPSSRSGGAHAKPADPLPTISDIVREETPVRRLGALGGPVQADELHHGTASALVVGSHYQEVTSAVVKAFSGPWLRVYPTHDLRGVELASAMVGCMSVGVGFAKAAGAGPGLLAVLISRAVHDAGRIAAVAGAEEPTIYGLPGYGDLLASIALDRRPEVVVGRSLAQGKSLDEAIAAAELRVEAVALIPRLVAFARARGIQAPAFEGLARMLSGERGEEILGRFFQG
ncbi:MAG: NAD(P)-binding domain-containing protein [Polyangiaceae bacterium]